MSAMPYHNPMISLGGGTAPMSGYSQTPSPVTSQEGLSTNVGLTIDGTPTRVATIAVVTLAGIALFKFGGIKFNIAAGG